MSDLFKGMDRQGRRAYLIEIRDRLGMVQARMAEHLGMSLRAYSDLETGKAECRPIHILAAERVALGWAGLSSQTETLPDNVLSDAMQVARARLGDRILPSK